MAESAPERAGRISKVVIVGRDDSLWLSVNILKRALGHAGLEFTAVELPSLLRVGDVYSTLKQQEAYHSLIGIQEAPMMQASQATYALGQRFSNWAKTFPPFVRAYSSYGHPINGIPFHHFWVKARSMGMKTAYEDFSINAAAAKQGRFFFPGEATDGFGISDYGYNLEAAGYCNGLKNVAIQRGVGHVSGRIAEVLKDPNDGNITAVKLVDGRLIEGDVFIDASGSDSALLGKVLDVPFESWRNWFPCDRMLSTYGPPLTPLPSFSQNSAFRSGWIGLYPLQNCTAVQQVYTSIDMSDEQAFEAAGIFTSMKLNPNAVVTPLSVGTRRTFWEKNCIAIGGAAAVLDPIDSAPMHLNLVALSHLVALFPISRDCAIERAEYNKNVKCAVERIRDYQLSHYTLNQRYGQNLWDHCRGVEVPDMLRYKLELFHGRGSIAIYDDETFEEDDWIAMLLGHGLIPQTYDPMVDQMDDGEAIRQFQKMLGFIRSVVDPMKPMEAYLGPAAMA